MLKNILIPLDGSPVGAAALPYAQALAACTGARLTLVRAAHVQRPLGDAVDQQRAVAEAEDYLTAQARELVKHGFEVETGVPFGGSAARWILEEIGSVAGETLHHSPCPVMLIRPATLRPIEVPVPSQAIAIPAGA